MSVNTATVTAGATATVLYRNRTNAFHDLLLTTHGNSGDVYIGGSNVTPSSNGVVAPKSQNLQLSVPPGETLYCAGNGTDTVKWLTFT